MSHKQGKYKKLCMGKEHIEGMRYQLFKQKNLWDAQPTKQEYTEMKNKSKINFKDKL